MLNTEAIQIDILRHGQCVGGRIFRGATDVPLTEQGRTNMQQAVDNTDCSYKVVFSSPLQRCRDIAGEFAKQNHCQLQIDDDFRELFFGDWEGVDIDHIWQTQYQHVDAWYKNPAENTPPNGETSADFYARVTSAFERMLETMFNSTEFSNPNKLSPSDGNKSDGDTEAHGLLVVHAGVIRMLMVNILNMPLTAAHNFAVPYANISRIKVYKTSTGFFTQLVAHNAFINPAY